jgi:hypothetical protein
VRRPDAAAVTENAMRLNSLLALGSSEVESRDGDEEKTFIIDNQAGGDVFGCCDW